VLAVRNVAPTITTIANSAAACGEQGEDEAVSVTMDWTDPGLPDTFTAHIDWGDGAHNTYEYGAGTRSLSESHAYAAGGVYLIAVTLIDDDTGQAVESTTAYITGVGIVGDRLYAIGTNLADNVYLNPAAGETLRVQASFLRERQRFLAAGAVEQIVMLLCDGDDTASVAAGILLPVQIHGGEGDDQINGGGGFNVLLGGLGADVLIGGSSHDLLIGGDGGDTLQANGGRNLLIAGSSAYDGVALSQIDLLFELLDDFAEDGVLTPLHVLDETTVFDDAFDDLLLGITDLDLLFLDPTRDEAAGKFK
jgi:Ca2+-binding RTX toxin-like protein